MFKVELSEKEWGHVIGEYHVDLQAGLKDALSKHNLDYWVTTLAEDDPTIYFNDASNNKTAHWRGHNARLVIKKYVSILQPKFQNRAAWQLRAAWLVTTAIAIAALFYPRSQ